MSNDNFFLDCDAKSFHVTGYFPSKFDPFIPDAILIEKENQELVLTKDFLEKPRSKHDKVVKVNLRLKHGEWVVAEAGSLTVMAFCAIGDWRDRTAVDLVQKAMEIKKDPLRVLNMLESAARLRSFDLEDFASRLSTQRANACESLEEVFLRVRDNHQGGQKG